MLRECSVFLTGVGDSCGGEYFLMENIVGGGGGNDIR